MSEWSNEHAWKACVAARLPWVRIPPSPHFDNTQYKHMGKLNIEAVIFDLDGVVTDTAKVHSQAWKEMFDRFLKDWYEAKGETFVEFTDKDYLDYVDGKSRAKGVRSFLKSREVGLPDEKLAELAEEKNQLFNQMIDSEIEIYQSTVELIRDLKEQGVRIGLASSSKNAEKVLKVTGLIDLFETRIDGVEKEKRGLIGKPAPDIFLVACDELGVEYKKAVVVEDAVSGVEAGKVGGFGLVVGVARKNNMVELKKAGADEVVEDLKDISIEKLSELMAIKQEGGVKGEQGS